MDRRIISLVIVALVGLAGCSRPSDNEAANSKVEAPAEKRYPLRGEVVRLNATDKVAIIKHDEIEGFMEAMTMGFPVTEDAEWAKLREGMKLTATVVDRKDGFHITGITEAK